MDFAWSGQARTVLCEQQAQQSARLTDIVFGEGIKMKQYVLVYLGGSQPTDPEEANKHFAKYMEWLSALGDSVVVPTIPLKDTTTVRSDGSIGEGGSSAMSGFSIIRAESMAAALSIAQACPFLEIGGSLEVSEMMQVPVQ
jgi:hypothetical protein